MDDLLSQDKLSEQQDMEQAIQDAMNFEISPSASKLDIIEQAFMYKYASIWALMYKKI